jgi:hypothetical protein
MKTESPSAPHWRQALGTLHWCAAISAGFALLALSSGELPPAGYRRGAGAHATFAAALAMWPYLISWRTSRNRIPISRARLYIFIIVLAAATATEILLLGYVVNSDHPFAGIFAVTLAQSVLLVVVSSLFPLPDA